MARLKAVFANGVEWVYDPEVNAHATHYGDADGVQHSVISTVPVADDAELGFTEPGKPAAPAASEPASGDFVPSG